MMMCTPGLPVIMFIIVIISINYATLNTCCRPIFKPPLANAGALRNDVLHLFVCLSVCLSVCLRVRLFVRSSVSCEICSVTRYVAAHVRERWLIVYRVHHISYIESYALVCRRCCT